MGHRTRRRSCVRACRDPAKEPLSPRGPVLQVARALNRFPDENHPPGASPSAAPPKPPVCRDPSQAPGARPLDNGRVQTLHGNVAGTIGSTKVGDAAIQDIAIRHGGPRARTVRATREMSRMEANMSCGGVRIRVGILVWLERRGG